MNNEKITKDNEKIYEALMKLALGYDYSLDKGEKHVPPDLAAIKMLIGSDNSRDEFKFTSTAELIQKMENVLEKLKKQKEIK